MADVLSKVACSLSIHRVRRTEVLGVDGTSYVFDSCTRDHCLAPLGVDLHPRLGTEPVWSNMHQLMIAFMRDRMEVTLASGERYQYRQIGEEC